MASTKLSDAKLRELKELATGWGRLLAQEAFPHKLVMHITMTGVEKVAIVAARAIVDGAVSTMADEQALHEPVAHCSTC